MNNFATSLERKAAMYEMLLAMENDFIQNISNKLKLCDIPKHIIEKSNQSNIEDPCMAVLQGLDFQAYIEICNANVEKLNISLDEKKFLNTELVKIIPIRNNVMHPRPLGILDFYVVQGIFDVIDRTMQKFEWKNVHWIRTKITDDPDSLRLPPTNVRKSERIIENIPITVDFEDTSFIGRKKEIGELKQKLNKNNVHILSIIGDGGIGKTALAIKLLYDLLDDEKCKYELILWVSLKTNELNNYEFKEIRNSISTTSEMYMELGKFVGNTNLDNIQWYLIELAKQFDMLLVLDNLETINTSDIKEFLDRFTEYGKVLITSRIGLGEMEHRYKLSGLEEDDVIEYMNTLLELYGFESIMTEQKKKEIAITQLHSNPLAIKWFVRCMYNGEDVDCILQNKEELATFCMSNVFEKLSALSHDILEILSIANRDFSVAELMYYMDQCVEDYKDVSYAINELAKCNFIDDSIFRIEGKLFVTEFAKEFLKIKTVKSIETVERFKQKEIRLQTFLQRQLQVMQQKPYALKTFKVNDTDNSLIVVSYWLNEAVELFEKKDVNSAMAKLELAKKIAPNHYQCSRIAAYLYGTTSREKAKEEYDIAIECCNDNSELQRLYIDYAGFLLRCNEYTGSLTCLNMADDLAKGLNVYILLEKAKVLACIGSFSEANEVLDSVKTKNLSDHEHNILLTRQADVKKREAEKYDQRDSDKKLELLTEAFMLLESSDKPDRGIFQYMIVLISALSYMYYDEKAMLFLRDALERHYDQLRRENSFRKFRNNMYFRIAQISDEKMRKELMKYLIDFDGKMNELGENEGIVYVVMHDRGFGFFKNRENPTGVYFSLTPELKGVQLGSIVKYNRILDVQQGKRAQRIEGIRNCE